MAGRSQTSSNETIVEELDDEIETEEQESENGAAEDGEAEEETEATEENDDSDDDGTSDDDDETGDEEEFTLNLGDDDDDTDENEDEPAPKWVKDLRKKSKADQRRIRELEAKLENQTKAESSALPELKDKPQLEDFDYDEEQYDAALLEWNETKRQHDAEKAKAVEAEKKAEESYRKRFDRYQTAKAELGVEDYEDSESTVRDKLSTTQQGIIIEAADKPELLILALSQNPKRLAKLSEIENPIQFTAELVRMENAMKVTGKKKPPQPERRGPRAGTKRGALTDTTLDKLRAKAERTGDMTEVVQYKRQMRNKK